MPDSVPQGVARAFTALVPGMIFFTVASVLYGLCHYLGAITLPELIFKLFRHHCKDFLIHWLVAQ